MRRPCTSTAVSFAFAVFGLLACGGEPDDLLRANDHASAQSARSGTGTAAGTSSGSGAARGLAGDTNLPIDGAPQAATPGQDPKLNGCGGSAAQPTEAALVSSYIDTLPYAPANDAKRAEIIDAILRTCELFAPPSATGFEKKHCYAHLAAAIHKESTYNPVVSVTDSYATRSIGNAKANDPTVGLLQIRFSSTVHDFVEYGPLDALACVGCPIPAAVSAHANDPGDSAFWAITGPSDYRSILTTPACNVPLGAWYYYVNATGNGNATSTTYIYDYCGGKGTAANVITGLRSHLNGPSGGRGVIADVNALNALQSSDYGGYQYASTIKGWFDGMIGPVAGKDPFFFTLSPSPSTYCR
jgi:hypothetical protein